MAVALGAAARLAAEPRAAPAFARDGQRRKCPRGQLQNGSRDACWSRRAVPEAGPAEVCVGRERHEEERRVDQELLAAADVARRNDP